METLKEIIDQKEIEILSTKYLNDQQLIELVGFMIQKQSIINSLSLKEGSLTKTGISYLSKNYNRLFSLDLSENNLLDDEIEDIPYLTNLKQLCIRNNGLTQKGVELLQKMNLEYLNVEGNDTIGEKPIRKTSIGEKPIAKQ
jgi:hypothetical protein